MNSLSIIIPSKTLSNLIPCMEAVRKHEPNVRIIVVDDFDEPLPLNFQGSETVRGIRPFVFSRAINQGIRAAGEDGIVILNDDAILETPGGFSLLQKAADEHPEYGIIASTCNNVGNPNQWPKGVGLRDEKRMVCFVCVFISRKTIDVVGLLDERFACYSHSDDEYCYRVRKAGLRIGILDGVFVDHSKLVSTFRGPGGPGGEIQTGARIFQEIYGIAAENS